MKTELVHQLLMEATEGKTTPQQLFPQLPRELGELLVPVQFAFNQNGTPQEPMQYLTLRDGTGALYGAVFTDSEALKRFAPHVDHFLAMQALAVLQNALRNGWAGVVINPGSEELPIGGDLLRLLFREYALHSVRATGGGWVPVREDSLLVISLNESVRVVPVYLSEKDAANTAEAHGGAPPFVSWAQIRQRCREANAQAPFLQYGFPEQVGILPEQLANLCIEDDKQLSLAVERAIGRNGGVGDRLEVFQAMARLETIWVLTDSDGDPVSLNAFFPLFTSQERAEVFVTDLKAKNTMPGDVFVRAFPAIPLFRALAHKPPMVVINQGSEVSWFGEMDTIPEILRIVPS